MAAVRDGLSRARLVPLGTAWTEIQAGWMQSVGMYGRGEMGWHPLPPVGAYVFGQVTERDKTLGAGVRVEW